MSVSPQCEDLDDDTSTLAIEARSGSAPAAPPEWARTEAIEYDSQTAPVGLTEWPGTKRYDVIRLLGRGGMGSVYEVFDRDTQRVVALKTLLQISPASVYRFKQEFRTLADLQHPNLVHLYEFVVSESGDVFFTMELVRGVHLVRYIRESEAGDDYAILRSAFRQLVAGIDALHTAGKLHRDIKPSNVLVTPEGRTVVLDFGVAAELHPRPSTTSDEYEVVGTAAFMAPEQALAAAPHPSSDWYSVGVVLYVALVGSLPFIGAARQIMSLKVMTDPVSPRALVPGVPEDLDRLCMALLSRTPERRPTGAEILERLGGRHDSFLEGVRARPKLETSLLGREAHLQLLGAALDATTAGNPVIVFSAGLSGMGKSALMRQFLDDQAAHSDMLVLRGRAYERESVPFKAIDAVIDALSVHLVERTASGNPVVLPEDFGIVARIFTVLGRVPGTVHDEVGDAEVDPVRIRRRAFVALRRLIAAAAAGRRLIIYVDDAQWGDVDSAALLMELIRPPDAIPLLLVLSYRANEAQSSQFLREVRAKMPERVDLREVDVDALSLENSERLALSLLGDEADKRVVAGSVARESGGSPFLIEELVSSLLSGSRAESLMASTDLAAVTVEQMITVRSRGLPDDARRLLEVIAIEGRQVPVLLAASAAGVTTRTDEVLGLLRVRRFIRRGLRGGTEVVEMCHDRIRETVAAQITPEVTREHHAKLAEVLESTPDANPELIAVHLFGAGHGERGAKFAEAAAEQAAAKLAFDRAAQLFRAAATAMPASNAHGRHLRVRLAQVLEWAGRGTESARVYEEVARAAPASERTALERAAAEQLLTCGRIDEGTAVLHRVLSAVKLEAPRSAVRAILWLLAYRLLLHVRGLGFKTRPLTLVPERERLRLDALYTVALGFGSVDVVLSACMTARYLVYALRSGEAGAIQRAATLQMSLVSAGGGTEGKHELALEHTARRLVERHPNAEARAFFRSNIGVSHYCRGRWNSAIAELDAALEYFPAHRAGMTSNVHVFCICSLVYAGRIRELRRRLPRLITEAEERGDLFMLAHMRASHPIVAWLAADDLEGARRHAHEGMARWPRLRFVIQHWQVMLAEAQIELYAGNGAAAYERIERDLGPLRRSLLLQAQIISGLTDFVRGRAAVASIESAPVFRKARLREAVRAARRLERAGMPWTTLLASLLRAAVANARGDRLAAVRSLRTSIERGERAEMPMHGAAARHRLGRLIGGQEGEQLIAEADAAMAAEEISAPERWAAMYLPGRWERDSARAHEEDSPPSTSQSASR